LAWNDYLATCDTSMNIAFGRNPKQMNLGNIMVKIGVYEAEYLVEKHIEALQTLQTKVRELVRQIENGEDRGITYQELSSISFNGEYNLAQYVERQVKLYLSAFSSEPFDPEKHSIDEMNEEIDTSFPEMDTLKLKYKKEPEIETLDLHRVEKGTGK